MLQEMETAVLRSKYHHCRSWNKESQIMDFTSIAAKIQIFQGSFQFHEISDWKSSYLKFMFAFSDLENKPMDANSKDSSWRTFFIQSWHLQLIYISLKKLLHE